MDSGVGHTPYTTTETSNFGLSISSSMNMIEEPHPKEVPTHTIGWRVAYKEMLQT